MASNFGRNKNVASSGLSFGHPCLKDKLLIVNDLETGKKMQRPTKKHYCHNLGKSVEAEELGRRWSVFFAQKGNARCIPHVHVEKYVILH